MDYRLTNRDVLANAIRHLSEIEPDGKTVVSIREYKPSRSLEQNAMYWGAWLPYLVGQTGYTVEELHNRFKRTFMLHIYLQEQANARQREWVELYTIIKRDGTPQMVDRALATISTTWATVEQFSDYLQRIEHFCYGKGYALPLAA